MTSQAWVSGVAAAVALALRLGLFVPLGSTVCGVCDLVAVVSGLAFIGLVEGA